MSALPPAFYLPDGDGYVSTELTRGPWDPNAQHAGPPAALLSREIDRVSGLENGQTARLSFDILRPVPVARLQVSARVLRPGKRVELVEGTLSDDGGEPLMRATAWRIRRSNEVAGHENAPPDGDPELFAPAEHGPWWAEVSYPRAWDWRMSHGAFTEPGPGASWTRLLCDLVDGEPVTPLQHVLAMADAASGISAALDWTRFLFINVDIGVHLERPPEGEWMSMDAVTHIGPEGAGLCTSVLGDTRGRIGISTQSLLVAPR